MRCVLGAATWAGSGTHTPTSAASHTSHTGVASGNSDAFSSTVCYGGCSGFLYLQISVFHLYKVDTLFLEFVEGVWDHTEYRLVELFGKLSLLGGNTCQAAGLERNGVTIKSLFFWTFKSLFLCICHANLAFSFIAEHKPFSFTFHSGSAGKKKKPSKLYWYWKYNIQLRLVVIFVYFVFVLCRHACGRNTIMDECWSSGGDYWQGFLTNVILKAYLEGCFLGIFL